MASQRRRLYHALTTIALPGAALGIISALPMVPAQAQSVGANLKVLTPRAGESLGGNSFSLDVSFRSVSTDAPVTTAELWVDGVRWVHRNLDVPQVKNVLSFAIDASTLNEGSHTFLVRVVCADGTMGEVVLPLTAGSNDGVSIGSANGPELTFKTPTNGRRVMGQVELLVDSPAKNSVNPFVTIYVDKQFKTLMNMPPYSYTWDSSNVPNGFHEIEATGYLESSNESTTRKIRVIVDNPGGNTEIKKDIPDLSAPGTAAKAVVISLPVKHAVASATKPRAAAIAMPEMAPVYAPELAGAWSGSSTSAGSVSMEGIMPAHVTAMSGMVRASLKAPTAQTHVTAVPGSRAVSSSTDVAGIRTAPASVASTGAVVAPPRFVIGHPYQTFGLAPVTATASYANRMGGSVTDASPFQFDPSASNTTRTGARAVVRPHSRGMLNVPVSRKLMTVAFNGQQIAFDVPPRVEAGLPLAPFRQIFEHTGGQVDWAPLTQVVHAVNSDREIVITVGQDKALVNGEPVTMQRAAFVERGRTIVPLSFVGAALNVKVNYDSATGRLQITSK